MTITSRIAAGESVTDVADSLGVTVGAVYLRLRRAGTPKRSLGQRKRRGVKYVELRGLLGPGYRVGSDGSIQSCVSPRTGELTEDWHDLVLQPSSRGTCRVVSLGSSNSPSRRRIGVKKIYVEAFGAAAGGRMYERLLSLG